MRKRKRGSSEETPRAPPYLQMNVSEDGKAVPLRVLTFALFGAVIHICRQ